MRRTTAVLKTGVVISIQSKYYPIFHAQHDFCAFGYKSYIRYVNLIC